MHKSQTIDWSVILNCRKQSTLSYMFSSNVKVKFATTENIDFVVKGGGHSTTGTSSTDGGIVIDLAQICDVTVDAENKLITAGGGALWRDVDYAAGEKGLATGKRRCLLFPNCHVTLANHLSHFSGWHGQSYWYRRAHTRGWTRISDWSVRPGG